MSDSIIIYPYMTDKGLIELVEKREYDDANKQLHKVRIRCSEWTEIAGKHGAEIDKLRAANAQLIERIAALGKLPEPPTVDGKTPGQVAFEVTAGNSYVWTTCPPNVKEQWEKTASAVLAAFGNQSQPAEIPWTEWHGGECPLKDEEVEEWEYQARDGFYCVNPASGPESYKCIWQCEGALGISAYRVIKWRNGCGPVDWKAEVEHHPEDEISHAELWAECNDLKALIKAAQARAEKAEAELARVSEACDRMSEQEVLCLSRLRPISEAGPVPEGCVRVTGFCANDIENGANGWVLTEWASPRDTHFADIQIPVVPKLADKPVTINMLDEVEEIPEPETFEAHGKPWTRHTPDYGEPWKVISPTRTVRDRHDKIVSSDEAHSRMLQCVNACRGMADPAAEIEAMRDERDELRRDIAALLNALPNGAHDVTEGVGTIRAMRDAIKDAQWTLTTADLAKPRF